VPEVGEACTGDKADVAGTEDPYPHRAKSTRAAPL
jgi:hypothetical protein